MNDNLRIPLVIIVLFLVFSSGFLQTTQAGENEAKALFQSFLTKVLTVDLAKYSVDKSGYGLIHPPKAMFQQETVSYMFYSAKGTLDATGIIDGAVIVQCSLYSTKGGSIIYTTPQPSSKIEAAKIFLQNYKAFTTSQDTSYLTQAVSILDGIDAKTPAEKVVGNMEVTVVPDAVDAPTFTWTPIQEGIAVPNKNMVLRISNENRVTGFANLWSQPSNSNQTENPAPQPNFWQAQLQWSTNLSISRATKIIQTADGGFGLVGTHDMLSKVNSVGAVEWTRSYGFGYGIDATQIGTNDSGFAICYFSGRASESSSVGCLLKIDSNGDTAWNKTITVPIGYAGVDSLIQTLDGGFAVICGSHIPYGFDLNVTTGAVLLKTDGGGNVLWSKMYDQTFLGGIQTGDEGFALIRYTGTPQYPYSRSYPLTDTWLGKTDSKGEIKFSKTLSGIISDSIIQTKDGGYVLCGYTGFTVGVIQKIDSAGNTNWTQYIPTTARSHSSLRVTLDYSMETPEGDYLTAGTSHSYPFFARLDSSGNVKWSTIPDVNGTSAVLIANDGGFVTASSNNSGVFLEKFTVQSVSAPNLSSNSTSTEMLNTLSILAIIIATLLSFALAVVYIHKRRKAASASKTEF